MQKNKLFFSVICITNDYVYFISLCVLAVFRFLFVSSFSFESNLPKKWKKKKIIYIQNKNNTNFHKKRPPSIWMWILCIRILKCYYYYYHNYYWTNFKHKKLYMNNIIIPEFQAELRIYAFFNYDFPLFSIQMPLKILFLSCWFYVSYIEIYNNAHSPKREQSLAFFFVLFFLVLVLALITNADSDRNKLEFFDLFCFVRIPWRPFRLISLLE